MPTRVVLAEDNDLLREGTAALLGGVDRVEVVDCALRGGAAGLGYLLKERIGKIAELTRSLAQVAAGGAALDPTLIEALLQQRQASRPSRPGCRSRAKACGVPGRSGTGSR